VNLKQSVIVLGLIASSAVAVISPPHVFAQETKTIAGMIQIERNHLYMISVGSDHGVAKGDMIEIHRIGVKVGEARLISVLADSSMAEIIAFYNVTDVFESDSVQYVSNFDAGSLIKPTLSTSRRETSVSDELVVSSEISRQIEKKGLLGSDTSTGRQIYLAKEPLQKEIQSLKTGIEILEEDFDGKMEVVLDTVKAGSSRAALNVEKKWKKKLAISEKKYQDQLAGQRVALEDEFAQEKDNLEKRIESLSRQISEAGETGDKRTQQLMSDLESTELKINRLRGSYEQERTFDEGRWLQKIDDLERKYQTQLRNQQNEFKRELIYSDGKYQDEISFLNRQLNATRDSSKAEVAEVRELLKNEQSIIASLRKEKTDSKADIGAKNKQLVRSKKEAIDLQDRLKAEKQSHAEKLRAFKLPYEREIKELKQEIAALEEIKEKELKSVQAQLQEERLAAKDERAQQLSAVEGKYRLQLNQREKDSKEKINRFLGDIEDRDQTVRALEKESVNLTSELRQNAKHVKQLVFNIETLKGELEDFKDQHERELGAAKDSKKEDKSLIEFLNNEMVTLTDDIEDKDQTSDRLEQELAQKHLMFTLGYSKVIRSPFLKKRHFFVMILARKGQLGFQHLDFRRQ